MSADQPRQSGTKQTPQDAFPGHVALKNPLREESELVNLYRHITQASESQAKNVLMFVIHDKENSGAGPPN
jgi:hypothetical protein